ncbi:MAG TPA: hypothetical protein PLK31_00080, partial [Chloroflexota bacterium]|nr:hypothetical protein [Chloroflexota bacterium]
LLTLAPHLRPHHPHVSPNPPLEPEFEQQRLFDSFTAWCEWLAADTPLLFLVEDVHWADSGTLALLRHVARRIQKARLLLVLTYRDTEVALDQAHPLHAILHDLNRERLVGEIHLGRLSREQTAELLAAVLSTAGEISPEFVTTLYRETEGNPFFVEEVCKGLIEQGKLYHAGGAWRRADLQTIFIPPGVRSAILARVERLPAEAQDTLRLAAVLGREFDFEMLAAASDQDEENLIAALEPAERAQLIEEMAQQTAARAGRIVYTFAHALIPFVLRESLNGLRRQRLHGRVAKALEAHRPHDVEALAYHFAAAGEREQAIACSRRAAERAEAIYAYDTAVQHWQIALDLLAPAYAGADEQPEIRLALVESLADVYRLRGDRADAIQTYQQALAVWRGMADGEKWTAVRLHRKTGETFNRLGKAAEIEQFKPIALAGLETARQLIAAEPPHPETVRLLTALANYAYWESYELYGQSGDPFTQGEQFAHAAVAMAEQLDAPVELLAALEAQANLYSAHERLREGVEIAQRRLALSRTLRLTNPREQVNILSQAGSALCAVGDYAQALACLLEAERLADEIHDWGQVIYTLNKQIQCFLGLDRWEEILQIEDKRLVLAGRYGRERIGRMCFQCGVSAYVHGWRGEMELARAHRQEAYQMMADSVPLDKWLSIQHY